ncbi:hypothetical protein D9M69_688790 [compost metagenome]
MSVTGPFSLFLVTATAHTLITAYAIIRSRRRAPLPAASKDTFQTIASSTGPVTTPEGMALNPRAASQPDADEGVSDERSPMAGAT